MDGVAKIVPSTKGIKISRRKIKEFLLIFSFFSPWIRKTSKKKMLIGSMAAFCFEAKARAAQTRQMKKRAAFSGLRSEVLALR